MNGDRSNLSMLYAGVVGASLVVVGIIGFFYNAEFTSDESVRDAVFGVFDVNGWHNVVHILAGVLGLLAYGAGAYAARTYAMTIGLVFLALAAWGFMVGDGDSILSIIPVNTEDNILHLLLGVAGLGAALATPAEARASAPPAAA
jgi:uncharacterized protein DUF4383